MTLALRLGRTVGELMATMSAAELLLWRAYDAESPLADARGDIQAALVASSVFQAQGAKVKLTDVLPRWDRAEPSRADSFHAFVDVLRTGAGPD